MTSNNKKDMLQENDGTSGISAPDVLSRLFAVVVEEAKANPDFAKKMVEVLPDVLLPKTELSQKEKPQKLELQKAAPVKKPKAESKTSRDIKETGATEDELKLSGFKIEDYHAVNILRNYDAGVLEGKLSDLNKEQLKQVAKYSGLVLTGPAAKKSASKTQIIQGIIEAAQQYIDQRKVAIA